MPSEEFSFELITQDYKARRGKIYTSRGGWKKLIDQIL
mgnify:CR=1 FL=1